MSPLTRLWIVCFTVAVGCNHRDNEASGRTSASNGDGRRSSAPTGPSNAKGFATIDDAAAAMPDAIKLGESTWSGARVGGVRVSNEVPNGAYENAYALRVSFEFASDAMDATAKSGSVLCAPECAVIRHKVKHETAAPFPCSLGDALAAARSAGLEGKRPVVGYGYWNLDERTGWTFRADAKAEPIEIGPGCVAKGR